MSGRADRRVQKKDLVLKESGFFVLLINDMCSNKILSLIQATVDPITSSFHLTFYMVLKSILAKEMAPEDMLKHSFT